MKMKMSLTNRELTTSATAAEQSIKAEENLRDTGGRAPKSETIGKASTGEMRARDQEVGPSAEEGIAGLAIDTALRQYSARAASYTRRMTEGISRPHRDDCPVHGVHGSMQHEPAGSSECCCFFCPYHDQCDCIVRRVADLGLSDLAFGMDIDSCEDGPDVVSAGAQADEHASLTPRVRWSATQSSVTSSTPPRIEIRDSCASILVFHARNCATSNTRPRDTQPAAPPLAKLGQGRFSRAVEFKALGTRRPLHRTCHHRCKLSPLHSTQAVLETP